MKKNKNKNEVKSFCHLSLDDRNIIEEELNQGSNFSQIAEILKNIHLQYLKK